MTIFFGEEKFSAQPSKNKVGDENLPLRTRSYAGLVWMKEHLEYIPLYKNKSVNSIKNIFNSRLQS